MTKQDPVLANKSLAPAENGRARSFKVFGGLHYIEGNSTPYFTITAEERTQGRSDIDSGGCLHGEIERHFPGKFSDLIAMHLSDIDGSPMSAEANGWYDLAGALGGAGERYHRGNSKQNFPCEAPGDKPWLDTEHRLPTENECLAMFADHCRIAIAEASAILDDVRSKYNYPDMRARWAEICKTMRPRWKTEAQACIAKHGLVVYGDAWEQAA